ncbi:MAG: DegT/DnrJ/EryC1/StrS family aminotransferase [Acidimicrobiia bacterium]|nr:DegT/DnrJ/EryC1/StrS family aminotransferase [Acidimicrobiia bacterium]MCY4433173.1 DegT/DnrJ/EryC1/StrS family aminotransferase [bacterium]
MGERIFYAASVHDEAEIEAVVEVLRGGAAALWPGRNVTAFEWEVAERFGKQRGLMCNSGSSALYLAVEMADLPPGSEVITAAVTFSTDVAPLVRAGLVPVFADVDPDTYQIDVDSIESLVGKKTRAILAPNLIGNAPDWDAIRAIADRHSLFVIEDSCDALGPTLRGSLTGTRSDLTVTSFASSHIITCAGNGGMVLLDDEDLRDRGLLLRRWGRRSELHFYGSKRRDRNFWEDLDGIHYDNQFIFDELAWNFEPSEIGAAFGRKQLDKVPQNFARRTRSFDLYTDFFSTHTDRFRLPLQTEGLDTAWLCYPLTIAPDAGFVRADLQAHLDGNGVDTRTVWTGNATRQPFMSGVDFRQPDGGLPNADAIMERGVVLPMNHSLDDDDIGYVTGLIETFLTTT